MKRAFRWVELVTLNGYQLGLSMASNVLSPLLLPAMVFAFMPPEKKNTYTALVYTAGLTMAMFIQPVMGMLSDRCTSKLGRRRPFIITGALLNVLFIGIMGTSIWFIHSPLNGFFQSSFGVSTSLVILLAGFVLQQFSSNISQAGQQGLIPDLVAENQHGLASGIKSFMEMLPAVLVLLIAPLVDQRQFWFVIAILMAFYVTTMLVTVLFTREEAKIKKVPYPSGKPILRMLLLTVIFVGITQLSLLLVKGISRWLPEETTSLILRVTLVGLAGLIGMTGSIFFGVYFGARVGIGKESGKQKSFIWWVVTRLLFMAAANSVRNFAMFFISDILHVPNPAQITTYLIAVVFIFMLVSSLAGGILSDRFGRKNLLAIAGILALIGTILLVFSRNIPTLLISGCFLGLGTGIFMATNWALGTDLVPKLDAGRYLGISNLAGAGAGIIGSSIGGPLADYFNTIQTGLGYSVIFALYSGLFLLSVLLLPQIKTSPLVSDET